MPQNFRSVSAEENRKRNRHELIQAGSDAAIDRVEVCLCISKPINDTVLERIKSVAGVLRARKRDSSAGWMVYLVMDKSKDAFVVERDILEILAPLQVGMGG